MFPPDTATLGSRTYSSAEPVSRYIALLSMVRPGRVARSRSTLGTDIVEHKLVDRTCLRTIGSAFMSALASPSRVPISTVASCSTTPCLRSSPPYLHSVRRWIAHIYIRTYIMYRCINVIVCCASHPASVAPAIPPSVEPAIPAVPVVPAAPVAPAAPAAVPEPAMEGRIAVSATISHWKAFIASPIHSLTGKSRNTGGVDHSAVSPVPWPVASITTQGTRASPDTSTLILDTLQTGIAFTVN